MQRWNSTLQIGVCAMGVHGQWVNVTLQNGPNGQWVNATLQRCTNGDCHFTKRNNVQWVNTALQKGTYANSECHFTSPFI